MRCLSLGISFLLLLSNLSSPGQSGPDNYFTSSYTSMSGQDSALKLLDEAMALMKKYPFKKETIEWESLRSSARAQLATARKCDDAHDVIKWCMEQLSLSHSYVMSSQKTAVYNNDSSQLNRTVSLREVMGELRCVMFDKNIGYISVPWFSSTDPRLTVQLADSLQSCIRQLAAKGATRWIVDLRKNRGGNCWPMLAGIAPLTGDGVLGHFVKMGGQQKAFHYSDGSVVYNSEVKCRASRPVELLPAQRTHIAVLTSHQTSSSGEIVAIAFRGLPHARSIGMPTAGFTTGNTTFQLTDGSTLVLTICRESDRTGKIYDGKIMPDDYVLPDTTSRHPEDKALNGALSWLQAQ